GRLVGDLTAPSESLLADEYLRKAKIEGRAETFDLKLCHVDGSRVDTRCSCFWSDTEQKIFYVIHDATEQKKLDKLKQQFYEMLARDMIEPLVSTEEAIANAVRESGDQVTEESAKDLAMIGRSVVKMKALTSELIKLQQRDFTNLSLDRGVCDLQDIVADAVSL